MFSMILITGKVPFATGKDGNTLSAKIKKLGGVKQLAQSVVGRNTWIIMKTFHKLPNDPLMKTLTLPQREFIIASLNADAEEIKLAAEGKEATQKAYDNSDYQEKFYANHKIDLKDENDDLDEIYNQVKALTNDPEYEQLIDNRLNKAFIEKKMTDDNTQKQIDSSWDSLLAKMNSQKEGGD